MPLTLGEIAQKDSDVDVHCSVCGRRLGRYSASADEGVVELWDDPRPERNPYRKPAGARRFNILMTYGRNMRYQWRCGCGADIQRRRERLEYLEVDDRTDPPRVYV